MVSWMWTGWSSTAGGPAPAKLTAATRRKNLSPRARFRKVCWVTIMGRAVTGTHSEAAGKGQHVRSWDMIRATLLNGASLLISLLLPFPEFFTSSGIKDMGG